MSQPTTQHLEEEFQTQAEIFPDLEVVDLTEDENLKPELTLTVDAHMQVIKKAIKSINDVLGPQHFKSDWRLKWEKKNQPRKCTKKNMEKSTSIHHKTQVNKRAMLAEAAVANLPQRKKNVYITQQTPVLYGDDF